MLDVVAQFNEELVKKRGVPVQSYLVDDGWDDPGQGLWAENTNKFPGGFRGAQGARWRTLDAHLGIWISPLGGYGGAEERTATARKMGLIPGRGELDLAYPAYKTMVSGPLPPAHARGRRERLQMGSGRRRRQPAFHGAVGHRAESAPSKIRDVFINVTVGTWPSPFWLNHVDSTWRNGSGDVGWAGKGDDREKWLTFRDGNCRRFFVEQIPALSAQFLHAPRHRPRPLFPRRTRRQNRPHLKNEARSYFANGTSLQELYLTPSMMTPEAWDDVADAAKWAHANADVLVDSHWVGGDPLKLRSLRLCRMESAQRHADASQSRRQAADHHARRGRCSSCPPAPRRILCARRVLPRPTPAKA